MNAQTELRPELKPPAWRYALMEMRAIAELGAFAAAWPLLGHLPTGDGHPVLVIPGFSANDINTWPLRNTLSRLGYKVYGWGLGRNWGINKQSKAQLAELLERIHAESGRKLSLIGWSLGGVYVREMARKRPDLVRSVITLGSPINGHPHANNVVRLSKMINFGRRPRRNETDLDGFKRRIEPPPVPCTALHTRSDGLVCWHCTLEPETDRTRNVRIHGSHIGLICNPLALKAVAEALAAAPKD
jgi:pimeloyl-ACP methyl ester carboxylesterase